MMDALTALQTRNAASKLCEPAPDKNALTEIFNAALRVPDHARLRPWRFLHIDADARLQLGELFARATLEENPLAHDDAVNKARLNPLRAPLLIVVIARLVEHPKVPLIEQRLSAACAAQNILLASHALGYAGIWRTGSMAYCKTVMRGLGLADNEEIIGFLYLGTPEGNAKPIPELDWQDYCQAWPAPEA